VINRLVKKGRDRASETTRFEPHGSQPRFVGRAERTQTDRLLWSGRGNPIAKRRGAAAHHKASTSGEKKKRPPPKAQAASLVSAVTPLLSSATPLAPPSPHDNRFSVPSRLFVRAAADALEAVARRAQAALLRRGRRRGGPVSRALSFFFLACAFLGFGTGIGRPCLLSSRDRLKQFYKFSNCGEIY
jgi:hypothetical protein